jgi:hypothetical protein
LIILPAAQKDNPGKGHPVLPFADHEKSSLFESLDRKSPHPDAPDSQKLSALALPSSVIKTTAFY